MRKYRIITIIFFVTFLAGTVFNIIRNSHGDDREKELDSCETIFPDAEDFSEKSGAPPHYKAYKTNSRTGEEELIGLAFVSTDIVPEIRGYAGPIKLMVGTDLQGAITKVEVIAHAETPSYVLSLDQFLTQFSTLNIKNVFKLGQDIDGISRATITSEAITRAVEKSLKRMARDILHLEVAENPVPKTKFPVDQAVIPLLIFGIAILGTCLQSTALRWTAMSSGLVYLGIIKSTMVSVVQVANTGLLKFPVFQDSPLWYFLFIPAIGLPLILGMVYCGSVCPFVFVQEFLYETFKRFRQKENPLSKDYDDSARTIKYFVLFSTLIASFILGNAGPANIEPYLTFFTTNGTKLAWALLILILIISIFHFRFWCQYLCPIGALTGFLSRGSLFKIELEGECPGCQVCEKICPTRAISSDQNKIPVINPAECILCNKCMQACPKGSLQLRSKA